MVPTGEIIGKLTGGASEKLQKKYEIKETATRIFSRWRHLSEERVSQFEQVIGRLAVVEQLAQSR